MTPVKGTHVPANRLEPLQCVQGPCARLRTGLSASSARHRKCERNRGRPWRPRHPANDPASGRRLLVKSPPLRHPREAVPVRAGVATATRQRCQFTSADLGRACLGLRPIVEAMFPGRFGEGCPGIWGVHAGSGLSLHAPIATRLCVSDQAHGSPRKPCVLSRSALEALEF